MRVTITNHSGRHISDKLYTPIYDKPGGDAGSSCGPAGCANAQMKQRQYESFVGTKLIQKSIGGKLTFAQRVSSSRMVIQRR